MPLYEFRCPNGHDFEKFFRSIGTASSEAECPVCGAIAQQVMSTAGLVFKGSGFYITDYGKDGKKAERDAATAQKAKSDAAASTTAAESGGAAASTSSSESAPGEKSKSAESAPKSADTSKPAAPKPPAGSKKSE